MRLRSLIMPIPEDRGAVLIPAVVIVLCLLASACVNAPAPAQAPPPARTPANLTVENISGIQVIPPPGGVCNCPMEPAELLTVPPTPTPDDGLCHCP